MSCAFRVTSQAGKRTPAVFIVREHVEALARRRQQDTIARDREFTSAADDLGKTTIDPLDRSDAAQVPLDEIRGFPEREHDLAPLPNGVGEVGVRFAGVTAA
jgi:hypothetical protein